MGFIKAAFEPSGTLLGRASIGGCKGGIRKIRACGAITHIAGTRKVRLPRQGSRGHTGRGQADRHQNAGKQFETLTSHGTHVLSFLSLTLVSHRLASRGDDDLTARKKRDPVSRILRADTKIVPALEDPGIASTSALALTAVYRGQKQGLRGEIHIDILRANSAKGVAVHPLISAR
ncbi:MAG: hypothetical protein NDJ90_07950 [Oligoflexia bacterium]|nr:hypothetical protein [Oligoflexia bacterium]